MTENNTTTVSPPAPKKVESCGGNACPTCGKCCDWYRSISYWRQNDGATCSGTVKTDVDGHPDGGGSNRTYLEGHGNAADWDSSNVATRDNHGGRYGHGVCTITHGTAQVSNGHLDLCVCKKK